MTIRTWDLNKRYGAIPALIDLNLEVPEGAVFALLGPNGAGKTTAIRILLNIVRAASGRAELLGTDSRKLGPAELAQIGYVSENRELPDWMSVASFLEYCRPFYPNWKTDEAAELVKLFELPLNRKLRSLSRGMRMKAQLAAALAYRPRLLILDEPFSGLDVVVREQLLQSIAERTPECTVLIATHDLSDVESFATHVAYLSDGRLLFAEEMDALTWRFREIEAVADSPTPLMQPLPADWLNLKQSADVIRFTHSHYDAATAEQQLRQYWQGIRDITVRTLPLRSIFLALANHRISQRS
jgi:ABC-2 type transport system ATP-binding protein